MKVILLYPIGTHVTFTWWRHQTEPFSAFLDLCSGNSPVTGEFPSQRPVTRSPNAFFDLGLHKRMGKQSWGWRFETPSSLYDVTVMKFIFLSNGCIDIERCLTYTHLGRHYFIKTPCMEKESTVVLSKIKALLETWEKGKKKLRSTMSNIQTNCHIHLFSKKWTNIQQASVTKHSIDNQLQRPNTLWIS